MISTYIRKNRRELMAILKHRDEGQWHSVLAMDVDSQVHSISSYPGIRACISYHILSQAGYAPNSLVQRRSGGEVFTVSYSIITSDSEGNPQHIAVYGKPDNDTNADSSPGYIGRIEEFVSMSTGMHILPGDVMGLSHRPKRSSKRRSA